ncbi:MAG: filamentous hemagglutinin N-terminal domain-containing protein [Sulfuritalea sp.]
MSYRNPSPKQSSRLSTSVRLGVAAVAACFIAAPVFSNPVNPTVVNGTASFNQAGNVLTVTNSNGAIINWDKFSIQRGETTHFAQTSASSSVMNRVLNDPTVIYGTLSSNGRVWLVNPAGIFVGPGGRVDVAAFVAIAGSVTNGDFLANRLRFDAGMGAGNVVNQGQITTPLGGSVYLIGSNVTNEGIITTPQGETILAAGSKIELIDSATPGVKVEITGAEGNATNLGTITAEAGRIGIAGVIVRNSGQLNASSVVSEGGRIFLKASQDAYVDGNGRIVTTGTKGGSVEVLGDTVTVTDNAEIDASGTNGGGRIMVGGDYQGKNPALQNAAVSYFGSGARLKADATEVGDGGTVIVWADDTTGAYGNISARGGVSGGNGGFVETSGHLSLDISGVRVDTRAPQGRTGNWLLDPVDVLIDNNSPGDTFSMSPGVNSHFYAGDIATALGTTNVTIQTYGGTVGAGNITVSGASIFYGGASSLTLAAYGGGSATGNINITNSDLFVNGGVNLLAGWDSGGFTGANVISGKGDINISGTKIQSNGGAVNLWAGKDIALSSSGSFGTWVQGASMNVAAGNNLTLTGGSGDISGPQGPGVMLMSMGTQTVSAGNQILLQAGSANNTNPMYGGNMSGGGVAIWSDADQTVSAHVIKLYAGASGHDNGAGLHAYGNQAITITGAGGLLELKGGGDSSAAVYGGAGSYNNQARIEHGQWYANNSYYGSGAQTITIYGGGSVNLQAGSGTGALGYYSSDCYATPLGEACRGSSNDAAIYNGVGAQTLDFVGGGSLTITGGSAGTQNWAGINNQLTATTQTINGNAAITVTGGSGGGSALSYGGDTFQLSNDAGINSQGAGDQTVNASSITLNGGNATYGGAGISNDSGYSNYITTVGNLSMYGGGSSAGDEFAGGVYIGNKNGGAINLQIGGDLYIKAGSGTSSPAIIGTLDGPANVYINTGGNASIIAAGSGAGIGSQSTGYGGAVSIIAGNDLTITDSATRGVMIGSLYDTGSATSITLRSGRDMTIGSASGYGALIGVKNSPTGNSWVDIRAGQDYYGGGNLLLAGSSRIDIGGGYSNVHLRAGQSSATNGNITQNAGSVIYGGAVSFNADGNLTLNGGTFASGYGTTTYAVAGLDSGYRFGYNYTRSLYGGDVSIGGRLEAVGNLEIYALSGGATGTRGNITQQTGGIVSAGNIVMSAWGNVDLSGTVSASSSLGATAGVAVDCGDGCYQSPYASTYGGNVFIRNGAQVSSGSNLNIAANVGYGTYGNGNVTQDSGSSIVGASVNIDSGGSTILNGTVTADSWELYVRAGYQSKYFTDAPGGVTPYGGSISVAGALAGEYGVFLVAESGSMSGLSGDITQSAGSLSAPWGSVSIIGGGNVVLNGSLDGGEGCCTAITVKSGFSDYNNMPTSNGGNISLAGVLSGYGSVYLSAEAGSGSGLNGNVMQSAGSITATDGNVEIVGAGNVTLNSSVSAYGGSGAVTAGRSYYTGTASPYGGNVLIGGHFASDGTTSITANVGYGTYGNGNVTQASGSSIAGHSVNINSGGSTNLGGTVTATGSYGSVYVRAGYQTTNFGQGYQYVTPYGGNIALGSGSSISGYSVGLDAYSGTNASENGNILQAAGGTINITGGYTNYFSADGDLKLDGLVSLANGDSLYAYAGDSGAAGKTLRVANISAPNGGHIGLDSTGDIQVGSVSVPTGYVGIWADGAISQTSGSSLITADSIYLSSQYGGAAGKPAISANTSATSSLTGYVGSGATYGGISISNQTIAPSSISLTDSASYGAAVGFNNSYGGELSLSGLTFNAGTGDVFIASGGSMTGVDSTPFGGSPANVMLVAGTDMSFAGPLSSSANVGLVAGGLMNIDQPVSGANVAVVGGTTTIGAGGSVSATSDAVVFGSVINVGSGASVSGANVLLRGLVEGTGTLNLYGGVAANGGQLEFNLANVYGGSGGGLSAGGSTSNITGFASGNITLDSGAYFMAGNDVKLTMMGGDSTIYLSNGGYILANALTTIHLAFTSRSSGGIMIDGLAPSPIQPGASGSGFYVGSYGNAAVEGSGLVLAYANTSVVDPCVTNPTLCKVEDKPPTQSDLPPPPPPPKGDDVSNNSGGTEGTFGADESGGDKGNGKDEKKDDEKDKKDKKSDEAKDEKKDEKPAQKKVAQCS